MERSPSPGVRFYAQKDTLMEYLGIAAGWKKAENFAVTTDPDTLMVAAVVGAVLLIFFVRWLFKK